jgi:hypothetical protein
VGTRKCIGNIMANCLKLIRPMIVSHIRQDRLGNDPNRSRIGYTIKVDANENPTHDLTDGNSRKTHPATTDIRERTTRMMTPLFQHCPCGLGAKQKKSFFCRLDTSSSYCNREDNSSSNERERRSVQEIKDHTNTALASRRMNSFIILPHDYMLCNYPLYRWILLSYKNLNMASISDRNSSSTESKRRKLYLHGHHGMNKLIMTAPF